MNKGWWLFLLGMLAGAAAIIGITWVFVWIDQWELHRGGGSGAAAAFRRTIP